MFHTLIKIKEGRGHFVNLSSILLGRKNILYYIKRKTNEQTTAHGEVKKKQTSKQTNSLCLSEMWQLLEYSLAPMDERAFLKGEGMLTSDGIGDFRECSV